MLFKRHVLEGLADGTIDLAFRRWSAPRVRPGSRLRTAVGVVAVDRVDEVAISEITDKEARRAGFVARADLLADLRSPSRARAHAAAVGEAAASADLRSQRDGRVYRIGLRVDGPDPRVALREQGALTEDELAAIEQRLTRLDAASRHGPWTMTVLRLIRDRPAVRAGDLAPVVGQETQPFKRDVRKLKELGLSESLEVGYRLSPRGRTVLERLGGRAPGVR